MFMRRSASAYMSSAVPSMNRNLSVLIAADPAADILLRGNPCLLP